RLAGPAHAHARATVGVRATGAPAVGTAGAARGAALTAGTADFGAGRRGADFAARTAPQPDADLPLGAAGTAGAGAVGWATGTEPDARYAGRTTEAHDVADAD